MRAAFTVLLLLRQLLLPPAFSCCVWQARMPSCAGLQPRPLLLLLLPLLSLQAVELLKCACCCAGGCSKHHVGPLVMTL
jgi:hypothetical protein